MSKSRHEGKNDPLLSKTRATLEKAHNRSFSDEEAVQVLTFLRKLAGIAVENYLEDERRAQRLLQMPEGFHYDKPGYACTICDGPAYGKDSWFDRYGLKCRICQEAISRKEAPAWLGQKRDNWYSASELELHFNLKGLDRRRLIKMGLLRPRSLTKNGQKAYMQAFLIEDHPRVLPPKELLQGCTVIEVIDGQQWQCFRPWYRCTDPNVILKGYAILDHLTFA